MRITIDTELNRVIVPDSYYGTIDKRNKVIEESGGTKLDYVGYIKSSFEKAISQPVVRKSDLKNL